MLFVTPSILVRTSWLSRRKKEVFQVVSRTEVQRGGQSIRGRNHIFKGSAPDGCKSLFFPQGRSEPEAPLFPERPPGWFHPPRG